MNYLQDFLTLCRSISDMSQRFKQQFSEGKLRRIEKDRRKCKQQYEKLEKQALKNAEEKRKQRQKDQAGSTRQALGMNTLVTKKESPGIVKYESPNQQYYKNKESLKEKLQVYAEANNSSATSNSSNRENGHEKDTLLIKRRYEDYKQSKPTKNEKSTKVSVVKKNNDQNSRPRNAGDNLLYARSPRYNSPDARSPRPYYNDARSPRLYSPEARSPRALSPRADRRYHKQAY